jgi:hypothetical protein
VVVIGVEEVGDRRGFGAEADVDLVHQALYPASEFFDHIGGGFG